MNAIDCLIIGAKTKMVNAKEGFKNFLTSEKGVSNVVATIIILLIVVIIIGIFWDKLSAWLSDMMNTIFDPDSVPSAKDMDVE
ncbi:MAG: hypothetical protein IKK33_01700 [Lachnospiraceae bacterium]|nr:hypothetical protein [Lachnospiraceae bacterium]